MERCVRCGRELLSEGGECWMCAEGRPSNKVSVLLGVVAMVGLTLVYTVRGGWGD